MPRDTVRGAAAVDAWTSFVKAALGALGFALLAVGPLVPAPEGFAALPLYSFVGGGILVLVAATMQLRSMLVVLALIGLSAGLAATLVGHGDPLANRAALSLYCASAVAFGAVGRRPWMALPFLLIPILIVAPGSESGLDLTHQGLASSWSASMGCDDCLWAGLPAGLALLGAAIGEARVKPWVPVRPSALPLLILCSGLLLGGLVIASLLPDGLAFAKTVCLRVALLAGILGWVGLSYQAGRMAIVLEAAAAGLLVLVGALYVDSSTRYPDSFDTALLVTVMASLVPAVLAGLGLLVRHWIGTERPRVLPAGESAGPPRAVERKSFFAPPPAMEPALPSPLQQTGFSAQAAVRIREAPAEEAAEPGGATEDGDGAESAEGPEARTA